ncbi:MAG: hypothetical protein E6K94_00465 [Thaumarchaeota archaeon]|nr:MAG: hypothetical protein E6K94_00465 [Nitrososphaerota archaeon]
MKQRELTEKESKRIGELLSIAVNNKAHIDAADLQRASVLFYSVNALGYTLTKLDLMKIIEISDQNYPESTKTMLGEAANTCYDLAQGLANPENEKFKFKV